MSNAELSVTINIVVVLIGAALGFIVNLTFYRRAAIHIRLKLKIKKKYVLFPFIFSKIKELKENVKKAVINYKERGEKIMRKDIIDTKDEIVNSIVSNLMYRYPEIIIAIYRIGSYFDGSVPPNWVKNNLDIIVIVKSLEKIPKQDWTEIRFEKKKVSGNHVWLGFNTIEKKINHFIRYIKKSWIHLEQKIV